MCRHSVNRQELIKRIRDGQLGQIQLIQARRMGPVGPLGKKPPAESELLWQFRNFFRFYWVSGGLFAEMEILGALVTSNVNTAFLAHPVALNVDPCHMPLQHKPG